MTAREKRPVPEDQARRRRTGRPAREDTPAVAETPAEPQKLPPWVPVHPTVPDWKDMDW